jgi:adenylosuccinate synthase
MVIAIVGANWGDEGKGKISDILSKDAEIVIRFQGGANAGHTIVNEYGKTALHMLPSGIFRKDVVNIIGQGVAFDITAFFKELEEIKSKGVEKINILVSDRVQILMPYHIKLDEMEEERLGKASFGSTKSGIAPFYSDKYAKIGIQISEIYDDEYLKERLTKILTAKNKQISGLYGEDKQINIDEMYNFLINSREKLKPYLCNVAKFLNEKIKENKTIILEGQLGTLRDVDNGIYPFTTSSSPLAGFGAVGVGIPPYEIKKIYAITKAYSSCVGAGAFVTELFGEEAKELRDKGGEYGAKTGRPRRVGWFDAVATRYGCMVQGATDVVVSLVDVLSYLDKIPVCTAYEIDGKVVKDFPTTVDLNRAKPIYEYLDGWKCDISNIKRYEELPENARKYIEFIEKEIGCPIKMIGNGPKREDIIEKNK